MLSPSDRIHCCIPDCRRSTRQDRHPDAGEIICGRCWRTIEPRLRERYAQLHRRDRRVARLVTIKAIRAKRSFGIQVDQLSELFDRATARNWAALKQDATIKSRLQLEGTAGHLAARRRQPLQEQTQ